MTAQPAQAQSDPLAKATVFVIAAAKAIATECREYGSTIHLITERRIAEILMEHRDQPPADQSAVERCYLPNQPGAWLNPAEPKSIYMVLRDPSTVDFYFACYSLETGVFQSPGAVAGLKTRGGWRLVGGEELKRPMDRDKIVEQQLLETANAKLQAAQTKITELERQLEERKETYANAREAYERQLEEARKEIVLSSKDEHGWRDECQAVRGERDALRQQLAELNKSYEFAREAYERVIRNRESERDALRQQLADTGNPELCKLTNFFRNDEAAEGRQGDHDSVSTTDCAIRLIRKLRQQLAAGGTVIRGGPGVVLPEGSGWWHAFYWHYEHKWLSLGQRRGDGLDLVKDHIAIRLPDYLPTPTTASPPESSAIDQIIGRPDKPFHKNECRCQQCRDWIAANPLPAPTVEEKGKPSKMTGRLVFLKKRLLQDSGWASFTHNDAVELIDALLLCDILAAEGK